MKPKPQSSFPAGRRAVFGFLVILQGFLAFAAFAQTPAQSVKDFFDAIAANDTNTVFKLLDANTNLTRSLYYGRLPLTVAAAQGHREIIEYLLKCGADINVQSDTLDTQGHRLTALEAAIWYNQSSVVRLLLEAGADPNIQSQLGGAALHYAFDYQRLGMAERLLDHGANPFLERRNPYQKQTPLELAITESDGRLVPQILDEGPKFFEESRSAAKPASGISKSQPSGTFAGFLAGRGEALLFAAATRGELEAVQALLKSGVSAKGAPGEERLLLQSVAIVEAAAAGMDHFDLDRWWQIRRLLISGGAVYDAFAATALGDVTQTRRLVDADTTLPQARDHDGQTPLHWAVQYDQLPLTTFWLEAGASPSATNAAGQTALHIAAAKNLVDQMKVLLAAHAPTDTRDTNGWTPLDAAIHAQQTEAIRLLMSQPNAPPPAGRALALSIHQAAASGNLDALAILAEATNNLEARNELGLTPLQVAVEQGHLAAAAVLVDKGANVNVRDPDGDDLLLWAIPHSFRLNIYDRPPTNWLARLGTDPHKETYLKYLTVEEYEQGPGSVLQAASFLLASGIDIKATNHAGRTATQLASDEKIDLFFDRAPLLQLLAGSGGNMNGRDADGNTALHLAGESTFVEPIINLIANGADINATNNQGRTPLHKYVEKIGSWGESDDDTNSPFQLLLKYKPNVNAQDNDGLTPLHVLALSPNGFMKRQATALLLAAGADPKMRDQHGRTPAHDFLTGKFPWSDAASCIDLLVKAGADLSAKDADGKTPLHYLAALGGSNPLFFLRGIDAAFLAAKVDINARDNDGNTPLHVAAKSSTRDVFDWLVKQGADMDAKNNAGETPRLLLARRPTNLGIPGPASSQTDIFQMARGGNLDAVKKLLEGERKLAGQTNLFGQTPLLVALLAHQTNMVELLEQYGVTWDAESAVLAGRVDTLRGILRERPTAISNAASSGASLLDLAADNGNVEMIRVLLAANGDIQEVDRAGRSPLGHALQNKRPEAAALLLQHGAKETFFDSVYLGDLKIVSQLLASDNALAATTNRTGTSAVELAAGLGHADVLKLLLDNGASADATNARTGRTPLQAAVLINQTNCAQLLINAGASVERPDRQGFTPLHYAAFQGANDIAALLLQHKANPDTAVAHDRPALPSPGATYAGDTALHLAALRGDTNLIQLLLNSGASVNAANATGRTPLDLARQPGMPRESPGLPTIRLFNPLKPGEAVPVNRVAWFAEQKKAAAALLEASGGKQAAPNPAYPGPPRFGQ